MRIDWWTLGLQAVNVLVLIWLLSRFLFRPVAALVEQRRAAAAALLDDARAARAAAEAERDAAKAATAGLAGARSAALAQAEADAKAQAAQILAAARAEVDRLRAAADADMARARRRDAASADARASRLAVDIAGKLLSRLPDGARVAGFAQGLAEGVAQLPEPVRAGMGVDAPVTVTSARPLAAPEVEEVEARLAAALGRPVEIAVAADPALIAGLEIDMPHAVVRNSFRADLERIARALAANEETAA